MTTKQKISILVISTLAVAAVTATLIFLHRRQPVILRGVVLRQDKDPNMQLPIAGAEITASNGLGSGKSTTDAAGLFSLTLPAGLRRRQPVVLQFQHKDYKDLRWDDYITDKLYIARLVPLHQESVAASQTDVPVSNVRIRYSSKATTEANIGSEVKTFQVINAGNQPCKNRPPCAPNGKWKAVINTFSLDAGEGNEFRNARASCIAGPCPFTRIELEDFSQDRRLFNVSVRNWSDTTTYLLEAEVVHPMTSDLVRETYPVLFGRTLNFSLPPAAEGLSIEAEVKGVPIIFPLGPDLLVRWANCQMTSDRDQSRNYRCELKNGYRFR